MLSTITREQPDYQISSYLVSIANVKSPFIFEDMKLPGNTTTLLATGVVGIVEFLFTIPAVLWVDQIGRKKILIAGAAGKALLGNIFGAESLSLTSCGFQEWPSVIS